MPWAHHPLVSVQDPVLSKDPGLRCSVELDFHLGKHQSDGTQKGSL